MAENIFQTRFGIEQKNFRRRNMNIEHQIEFDKVKEMWMERAVTDRAKEQIKEITFYLNERELRWQLKSTTDSRNLMEKLGAPPLQKVAEIKEILKKK